MTTPHAVTGDQFSKMLMKAGHTKGYISSGMKKGLQQMKLQNGKAASAVIYDKHMHVDRHDAVKIIKKFKEAGLAHGVIGHAEEFVRHGYQEAHASAAQANQPKTGIEDAQKQAALKHQHLAERVKEMSAEKAAETAKAKTPTTNTKKTITPVQLAKNTIPTTGSKPSDETAAAVSDMLGLTPKSAQTNQRNTPTIIPGNGNLAQGNEEELIDMAID